MAHILAMRFTLTECLAVYSGSFIECPEGEIDGSNASLHRIFIPELTERLQNFARTQPSPLFNACLPPSDAIKSEKWKLCFPRNVIDCMTLIWRINKQDKKNMVSYTPSRRNGRRTSNPVFFSGLRFYDAATSGITPPHVPLVMASDLLIKMRVLAPASRANVLGNAPPVETFVWRKLESFRVGTSSTFGTLPETCVQYSWVSGGTARSCTAVMRPPEKMSR